jgi:hypothetical protein
MTRPILSALAEELPPHYPMLKNSNFGLDHNSEDRWQPGYKFLSGFGDQTGFAVCDPLAGFTAGSIG